MSADQSNGNKYVYLAQEFSLPLLLGVACAILFANAAPKLYDNIVNHTYDLVVSGGVDEKDSHGDDHKNESSKKQNESKSNNEKQDDSKHDNANSGAAKEKGNNDQKSGDEHDDDAHDDNDHEDDQDHKGAHDKEHEHASGLSHYLSMHFIVNELFMVLFFGIAAKEIAESCLPGGPLNPISKAVNPLMGTIGGVVGPVGVYLLLNMMMGQPDWAKGWGIPTATDIALAWLIARVVFGTGHPAISFLLLLAVADDGIGLMIIAIFYPTQDPVWLNALWVLPGMAIAYGLRFKECASLDSLYFDWWSV